MLIINKIYLYLNKLEYIQNSRQYSKLLNNMMNNNAF